MMRIEATIKPFVLDRVRESLGKLGIRELTEYQVSSFGAERGHQEVFRGCEYVVESVPRVKLDFVVQDALADKAIQAISEAARTRSGVDGTILLLPVLRSVTLGPAAALDRAS